MLDSEFPYFRHSQLQPYVSHNDKKIKAERIPNYPQKSIVVHRVIEDLFNL